LPPPAVTPGRSKAKRERREEGGREEDDDKDDDDDDETLRASMRGSEGNPLDSGARKGGKTMVVAKLVDNDDEEAEDENKELASTAEVLPRLEREDETARVVSKARRACSSVAGEADALEKSVPSDEPDDSDLELEDEDEAAVTDEGEGDGEEEMDGADEWPKNALAADNEEEEEEIVVETAAVSAG